MMWEYVSFELLQQQQNKVIQSNVQRDDSKHCDYDCSVHLINCFYLTSFIL